MKSGLSKLELVYSLSMRLWLSSRIDLLLSKFIRKVLNRKIRIRLILSTKGKKVYSIRLSLALQVCTFTSCYHNLRNVVQRLGCSLHREHVPAESFGIVSGGWRWRSWFEGNRLTWTWLWLSKNRRRHKVSIGDTIRFSNLTVRPFVFPF